MEPAPAVTDKAITTVPELQTNEAVPDIVEISLNVEPEPGNRQVDEKIGTQDFEFKKGSSSQTVVKAGSPNLKPLKARSQAEQGAGNVAFGPSYLLRVEREQYNRLIVVAVQQEFEAPDLHKDKKLVVFIEVMIGAKGQLVEHKLQRSSRVGEFDFAAITAVKTAQFPRLPEHLSKDPPYVVVLRISP